MQPGVPSRTAERVALRRATHQLLDRPPVFVDPLALRILDGLDERQVPRYTAMITKLPEGAALADANAKRDAEIEEQQRQWLAKNGQR
jgi:hypothetical protein